MNILNPPKPGMLIRGDARLSGNLIVSCADYPKGVSIFLEEEGIRWHGLFEEDEIKWPNEPDDAWRRVFEEAKPVREWCQVYMWRQSGNLDRTAWYPTRHLAEVKIKHTWMVGIVCHEQLSDGTWKIIEDEPKEIERPQQDELDSLRVALDARNKLLREVMEAVGASTHGEIVSKLQERKPERPPTKYGWNDPSTPDWAEWIATDKNGRSYYYSEKPLLGSSAWQIPVTCTFYGVTNLFKGDWRDSLEQRPEWARTKPKETK